VVEKHKNVHWIDFQLFCCYTYIFQYISHRVRLLSLSIGKTMVARILGRLLHMVGVLPTDKVTEVQRTDLVGEFVGHTGPKTRRKVCYRGF
jgi:hypothetical protein